jgi:hypothetical protein
MRSRNPHTSRGEIEKQKHDVLNESENMVPNNASSNNTIPMMRSKDSVNQYLKSTATNAKQLNGIEENSISCLREDISSVDPTSGVIRNTMLRTQPSGQSTSPSTPAEGTDVSNMVETEKAKIDGVGIRRKTSSSSMLSTHYKKEMASAYPDLGFLENDVGLWDAFFLHGKNSRSHRSVLRPPVPVEEYFRDQRQLQAITTTETQVDTRTIKSANSVETTSPQPQGFWPQQPSIRDLDSLRTLLPRSQQHLLGTPTTPSNELTQKTRHQARNDTKLPVAKIRPMTAGPSTLSRQNHDLQNQAIKSLFTQNSHIRSNPKVPSPDIIENRDGSVQVVKVREAWAPLPVEAEVPADSGLSDGVTRRALRPKSGASEPRTLSKNDADHLERNLNDAINNNGNEEDEGKEKPNTGEVELSAKRRSYHPQEYLSHVLHEQGLS